MRRNEVISENPGFHRDNAKSSAFSKQLFGSASNRGLRCHGRIVPDAEPECPLASRRELGVESAAQCLARSAPTVWRRRQPGLFARLHEAERRLKSLGRVSLATLTSPFQANANETPILVNGTPDVVDVSDEASKLDPDGNGTYASIKKIFPHAVFGGTVPKFESVQSLAGGGQRFVFLISIRDGCSACDEVAIALLHSAHAVGRGITRRSRPVGVRARRRFPTRPVARPNSDVLDPLWQSEPKSGGDAHLRSRLPPSTHIISFY